ncbi:hypothetical protein KIN20_033892 [Parelaphostrongylus tenuis]|uniref:Molybdopterin synthase catalytic subunit n=1 Tax=Parelaphostrongylus tenuis TaxID=148309 RepID=A0AAD5R8T9_PARTN|nr:hypothetical protein KIN20_033892 [Parelaphostrongylus tenuis]
MPNYMERPNIKLCATSIHLSLIFSLHVKAEEANAHTIHLTFRVILKRLCGRHTNGICKKALALAREDRHISFLDVSLYTDQPNLENMMSLIHALSDDVIRICYEPLDVGEAVRLINSPSCGATSVFVGTTRDTFNGKIVTRLDYESYDEMAYKELRKLCSLIRRKYSSVERVVIFHRIGEVPVGEISVIIATASPHRKDALHATEMAIDELKKVVPVWKKEVYEDGSCSWKENGEWRADDHPTESTEERSFTQASRTRDANRRVFWLQQIVKQMSLDTKPS